MSVNSSQDEGGAPGVWLRVRILNSLVFSLRTTVRALRVLCAKQTKAFLQDVGSLVRSLPVARRVQRYPRQILIVWERSGTTWLSLIPRASSGSTRGWQTSGRPQPHY